MDLLEQVMQQNAPGWSDAQRESMRDLVRIYLQGFEHDDLISLVREVSPPSHALDTSASWCVFATWAMRRAVEVGRRVRPAGLEDARHALRRLGIGP